MSRIANPDATPASAGVTFTVIPAQAGIQAFSCKVVRRPKASPLRVTGIPLVLAMLIALTAPPMFSQSAPLPKGLPPYGPLVPFHPPKVQASRLRNGLTLWLAPRPGFPKISLAVAVRGGMSADPKSLPGLSYLLLDTIDQGTTTRSARQIADAFQAAGGDLYGNPLADSDLLTVSVLASKVRPALEVLGDVLEHANFPDGQVALAKRNEEDGLAAREAEPSFLASRAFAKAIFGDHPYSVISQTRESILQANPEDLRRQYEAEFRPDCTVLVAVGDFEPNAFRQTVGEALGDWRNPPTPLTAAIPAPTRHSEHAIYLLGRPGSVQTVFLLGSLGPTERDTDYEAAEVASTIYGGMNGSMLFTEIREAKGYSYSPRSYLSLRREAGILETSMSVRNEVTGAALADTLRLLEKTASEAPAPQQLFRAKRFLLGMQALRYQLQSAVASKLASLWINGLPPEEIGEEGAKIQQITADQVARAGARYFAASRQTIIAVGDEKILHQQLAPLGIPLRPAP